MRDRRTATKEKSKDAVAKQWGRMAQDWCATFDGTAAELDTAMAHPRVKVRFYQLLRELIAEQANPLLQFMTTLAVAAREAFDASRYFVEEHQPDGIQFWLGDSFKANFVPKKEGPVAALVLSVLSLLRFSCNDLIMAELGENWIETTLGQFYDLIKQQANGPASREGVLLTKRGGNIFYIKDIHGKLWSVSCYWRTDYRKWGVVAYSVTDPTPWNDGDQVFSGDSFVPLAA